MDDQQEQRTQNLMIREGALEFAFGEGWSAIKYDDTDWYREHKNKIEAKAMDILAHNGSTHWWIEIKDCLGHEEKNTFRMDEPIEVAKTKEWVAKQGWDNKVKVTALPKTDFISEVIQKTLDTMAALALAKRMGHNELLEFTAPITTGSELHIVLFLTWSAPDFARFATRLNSKLKGSVSHFQQGLSTWVINETTTMPASLKCNVKRV